MKIGLAQINPTVGDLEGNCNKIIEFARRAQGLGAELVIFPELAICGYPARDLVEKNEFVEQSMEWLQRASREVPGMTLLCGCITKAAVSTGKSVHNSLLVLRNGVVEYQQSKMLLPTYDVFDELRNFAPAEHQRVWRYASSSGPLRIALTICEDAWNDKHYWPKHHARLLYARDPVEEQLRAGADFLINISASPYSAGKIPLRQEMLGAIAREYRVPVVFVNQVGGNDQLIFDGSSLVLGEDGALRARAASFEEDLLVVSLDSGQGMIRPEPASEVEARYRALVLGTRDYVHKCGFRQAVLGVSGGVDSALTAAIAVEALGPGNVHGLYLPTRYSSEASGQDAEALCRALGIGLQVIPIEPLFVAALEQLARLEAGAPGGEERKRDLAEQNVQSRLRCLAIMAYSNLSGSLVLSTGNKSELAMGYCTLYGDMAGGLAVISDVLKTQVYELAAYVSRQREVIPTSILTKAPTAELKYNQLDQDDLPPYATLDAVIQQYVEGYRSPEAIAEDLGLDAAFVQALIRRMDHSEYKRQQAAPGLKVSQKAFGMGRRLPIAQRYEAPKVPGDCLPALQ